MRTLLITIAIVEGLTGVVLISAPSVVISVLLGVALVEPAAIIVGRLAGSALLSIALTCWLYKDKEHNASGVIKSLMFYNIAAASLLVYAGLTGFSALGIWPGTLLHTAIAVWCVVSLRKREE